MAYIYKPHRRRKTPNRQKRNEIYNTTLWKKMRRAYIMEHPICEICELMGKTTLAEAIHHKISFMTVNNPIERDKLAFDSNNLMSLCNTHHSEIHNCYLKGCTTIEGIINRLKELSLYNK